MSNTKIIEIPALLRVMVPANTSPEEVERIYTASVSNALATVENDELLTSVKEHIEMNEPELAKTISHADIWVAEDGLREEAIVHEPEASHFTDNLDIKKVVDYALATADFGDDFVVTQTGSTETEDNNPLSASMYLRWQNDFGEDDHTGSFCVEISQNGEIDVNANMNGDSVPILHLEVVDAELRRTHDIPHI